MRMGYFLVIIHHPLGAHVIKSSLQMTQSRDRGDQWMIGIQELTIAAALSGDYRLLIQALLADAHI